MKTTTKKKNDTGKKNIGPKQKTDRRKPTGEEPAYDEEVAVLVDTSSGSEYYMFMIDEFDIGKRKYTVMVPYEPDRNRTTSADIIILRSQIARNGDQIYISIKDKKEINAAFDVFYSRFEETAKNDI